MAPNPPIPLKPVPWFEPHHQDELFDAFPPPTENAPDLMRDYVDVDPVEKQKVAGWATCRWKTLHEESSNQLAQNVLKPTCRERLGNLKSFKSSGGSGVFDKEKWVEEKKKQLERNKFSKSGSGRKRKIDEATGKMIITEEDLTYFRNFKFRVRFSEPRRQRKILNQWCGAARYTYNAALEGIEKENMPMVVGSLRDRYVVAKAATCQRGALPKTEQGWEAKRKRDAAKAAAKERVQYETGELVRDYPWLAHTPPHIRAAAVGELLKSEWALQKKAEIARNEGNATQSNQEWHFGKKSKSEPSHSTLTIEHLKLREFEVIERPTKTSSPNANGQRRKWTQFRMYDSTNPRATCKFKCSDGKTLGLLYLTEDLSNPKFGGDGVNPIPIDHDCKLTRDSRGRFFLHVPIPTPLPDPKPLSEREMCAIDPGARTPFEVWSPTHYGSFGNDDFKRVILPLCEQMDALIGRRDRAVAKWQRYEWVENTTQGDGRLKSYTRVLSRLELRIHKLRDRIKNLVNDLHKRVARSLLEDFDTILLPVFETSNMTEHINEETGRRRVLNSKTVRNLLTWSHWKFREYLKHKALVLGKEVVVVDESYTTKGCSRCGLCTDIGGSKTFKCANPNCGFSAPRDAKSARDIFCKHIVSLDSMPSSSSASSSPSSSSTLQH
jgi:IS605 OrfB family transposase